MPAIPKTGRPVRLPHTALSIAILLLLPLSATVHSGTGKPKARMSCTVTDTSAGLDAVLSLGSKSHSRSVNLDVTVSGSAQKQIHGTLRRGRQVLLTVDTMLDSSTGASTSTVTFGAGFRRLREVSVGSTDGRTFTGDVDGHQLAPFRLTDDPKTLRFLGAGPSEARIKVKHFAASVLRKLDAEGSPSCVASSATGATTLDFLGLNCDACQALCQVAYWLCSGSATAGVIACDGGTSGAGTPACHAAYTFALASCTKGASDCQDSCVSGDACCSVPCPGGHPNASSPSTYCKATCSDGAVCCGGASNPQATCCDSSSDCCGTFCLEGGFAGDRCVNGQTGAFCFASNTGDVCGDTSMPGFATCCPSDASVCRGETSPGVPLCCTPGAGDVCQGACCPAGASQCVRGACCAPQDVCGNGGDCCPSPHVCLGQQCCNPPAQACTGILGNTTTCCSAFEACNTISGVCCPELSSVVCGASCCDTTSGTCIAGSCCPKTQACGTLCCPAGDYCADPATGMCSTCPSGRPVCDSAGPGTQPVCCQPGQICCQQVPFDQCTDPADCRPIP